METIEEKKLLLDANTCRLIREYVPQRDTLMALSDFFATLSDSTRIKILSALSISPMCVNDISVMLGINQTTVSHQLKNLRSIGAVDYRRQGKISFYHIKNKRILDVMLSAAECIGWKNGRKPENKQNKVIKCNILNFLRESGRIFPNWAFKREKARKTPLKFKSLLLSVYV